MNIIVQKFGGTSVSSTELRNRTIQKIKEAKELGKSPVVVVSAIGREGKPYATDTLMNLIKDNRTASPRDMDLLISCGEIISAVILAAQLKEQGFDAIPITGGQAGIITDNGFGSAYIKEVDIKCIYGLIREGKIPVVAGFQGVTKQGDITTLGRGGSDITATILGEALGVDYVEIYTDVDGIMTADPRLVPNAKILESIDYNEVFQLAEYGANVIHPKAVEISMRSNIPIYIRNTNSNLSGTLITSYTSLYSNKICKDKILTGIAYICDIAQVKVKTNKKNNGSDFEALFFTELANQNISIDLINLLPEEKIFVINNKDVEKAEKILKENNYSYNILKNCCKVTAIGNGMRGVPGVLSRIVSALTRAEVEILQTSDSHTTISCLVKDKDAKIAVQSLHKEFKLE